MIPAAGGLAVCWLARRGAPRTDSYFDSKALEGGVDVWLEARESGVPALRPAAQKRVRWAGQPEERTDWSVVYIHGFSATADEIRPVPDMVADGLGANLVFTRLKGHGRDGPAMAEATVEGWMEDVAEALAIARRVGRQILVMGTSTGATLVTLALHEAMAEAVSGVVLISPNFRVADPKSALITWPGARWWAPLVAGREQGFEPQNARHAATSTPRYPMVATLPMAALVAHVGGLDHGRARMPLLLIYDPRDSVVDHAATERLAETWRGSVRRAVVQATGDPNRHVIAGAIRSPEMTQPVTGRILDWTRGI